MLLLVANNVSGVNSFAERYRVASSAPSSSLDVGDLYFDTTANELKVYKSSGWAAAGSTVNGTSERFTYNITGTPTTLTGASGTGFAEANSNTLAYDAGFIDVYLNGVKMVNGTDVTVTSGTSVVFASALSNGDVVDIVTFGTFNVANIVSTGALNSGSITSGFGNIDTGSSTITTTGAITGGTLTGTLQTATQTNITSVGTLSALAVSGATTITTADNTAQLELVSTDADSGIGPHQVFYRNSASPADGDLLCELDFRGRNDNSQDVNYATVNVKANDVTDGEEDGEYILQVMTAGSVDTTMHIKPAEIVFNEDSIDRDFRVESNGNANMLFIDGANDAVGIGNNNPADFGANTDNLVIGTTSGENGMTIVSGTGNGGRIQFADNTSDPFRGAFEYDHSSDKMIIYTAGSNRMSINAGGRIQTFNCTNSNGALNLVGEGGLSGRAVSFQHTTNGSEVGYIATNSTNTVYNTASDYRLKENVSYDFDATSRLKQLKPCRFNFKIDTDKTVDGFLAHEVSHDADGNPLVPEAISGAKDATEDIKNIVLNADGTILATDVSEDKWTEGKANETYASDTTWIASKTVPNYQGIDQSKLVPLLVKTIQELEARITALESA